MIDCENYAQGHCVYVPKASGLPALYRDCLVDQQKVPDQLKQQMVPCCPCRGLVANIKRLEAEAIMTLEQAA